MMKVKIPQAAVMAKFPVTLIPNGNQPNTFRNKMKKKIVNK